MEYLQFCINHDKHGSLWFVRTSEALNALQFPVAYLRCLSHCVHSVFEENVVRVCNYLGYSCLLIMFNMASVRTNDVNLLGTSATPNACFQQEFWILT